MILVLIGPMGCGKTTIGTLLAEKLHWKFEDGDDFHPAANVEKMKSGMPLNDEDRLPWLIILHDRIQNALTEKRHLVLACSALKTEYRNRLGIDQQSVLSVYLKGSPELLQERINLRTHRYMSKKLLDSQLNALEEPVGGLKIDISPSPERIVDTIINQIPTRNQTGTPDENLS